MNSAKMWTCILFIVCISMAITHCNSVLRVSNVFGSHMVLQHSRPVPIWGWDVAGSRVTTKVEGVEYSSIADVHGLWKIELPSFPASMKSKRFIFVNSKNEQATLDDVLFGDVFLCSGQSNIEFSINFVNDVKTELPLVDKYPYIRVMSGPTEFGGSLKNLENKTYNELATVTLPWTVPSAETFKKGQEKYYSAVCWFALKDTFDRLKGTMPLGGIVQGYGGTAIQQWSSPDAFSACKNTFMTGYGCNSLKSHDSCLYNSQFYPYTIGPMQFKLVLWYQGETNAFCKGNPQVAYYQCALPALIQDWRAKLKQPLLPFGLVELAAWNPATQLHRDRSRYAMVKLIQSNITRVLPNTFTISALDQGNPLTGDIHSTYKREVGARAALGAVAVAYGNTTVRYKGPTAVRASVVHSAGREVIVTVEFDPATLYGHPLQLTRSVSCPPAINATQCESLAVLQSDCQWVSVEQAPMQLSLSVSGSALRVKYITDATVIGVRLYHANWPLVVLRNAEGLPAEPFLFEKLEGGRRSNRCVSLWSEKLEYLPPKDIRRATSVKS